MAFKLPPLNSLRIFEAAARHCNFRRAAEELNVTASAVSHAMQTLEDSIGVELFHREARGLQLTAAGKRYLPAIANALATLARATEELPGRKATGRLLVSCAPTFAIRLLMPRLPSFIRAHPEISISVDTSRQLVDLPIDGVDAAIRSATAASAPDWTRLMEETLVPVCSPQIRAQFTGREAYAILRQAPLIHTNLSSDWREYFHASRITPSAQQQRLYVDTLQMAFEAAAIGMGIALGRRPLVDADLASGRLVIAVDRPVPGHSYWLITPGENFEKPEVKAFRRWLCAELATAPQRAPCPVENFSAHA